MVKGSSHLNEPAVCQVDKEDPINSDDLFNPMEDANQLLRPPFKVSFVSNREPQKGNEENEDVELQLKAHNVISTHSLNAVDTSTKCGISPIKQQIEATQCEQLKD